MINRYDSLKSREIELLLELVLYGPRDKEPQ